MIDTNEIRSAVRARINEVIADCDFNMVDVFYHRGNDKNGYPYTVFDFSSMASRNDDLNERLYYVDIDIYTRDVSLKLLDLCDRLEIAFDDWRFATEHSLTTSFFSSRSSVDDEDKSINHETLRFEFKTFPFNREYN